MKIGITFFKLFKMFNFFSSRLVNNCQEKGSKSRWEFEKTLQKVGFIWCTISFIIPIYLVNPLLALFETRIIWLNIIIRFTMFPSIYRAKDNTFLLTWRFFSQSYKNGWCKMEVFNFLWIIWDNYLPKAPTKSVLGDKRLWMMP